MTKTLQLIDGKDIERNNEEISEIIVGLIEKGANYIIKSMPINEHLKIVLNDVKDSFKEKEFKYIIKTAIASSIREGLDVVGIKEMNFTRMEDMIDISLKGGLIDSVNAGVDIVEKTKEDGNIFFNYIEDFLENVKAYIASKDFKNRIYRGIERYLDKIDVFKERCNDWYDAYENFDLDELKKIAEDIKYLKRKVLNSKECQYENAVIQNVMSLAERKNEKLTNAQFDICTNLEKIK